MSEPGGDTAISKARNKQKKKPNHKPDNAAAIKPSNATTKAERRAKQAR